MVEGCFSTEQRKIRSQEGRADAIGSLELAAASLRRLAGQLRHVAPMDADRRQNPPRLGGAGQSLVARAALCHVARPDDLADPLSRSDIPDRLRLYRP